MSVRYRPLASKVFRTGKQTLYKVEFLGGEVAIASFYAVRLENRTNDTLIRIPDEKVDTWAALLT